MRAAKPSSWVSEGQRNRGSGVSEKAGSRSPKKVSYIAASSHFPTSPTAPESRFRVGRPARGVQPNRNRAGRRARSTPDRDTRPRPGPRGVFWPRLSRKLRGDAWQRWRRPRGAKVSAIYETSIDTSLVRVVDRLPTALTGSPEFHATPSGPGSLTRVRTDGQERCADAEHHWLGLRRPSGARCALSGALRCPLLSLPFPTGLRRRDAGLAADARAAGVAFVAVWPLSLAALGPLRLPAPHVARRVLRAPVFAISPTALSLRPPT